MTLPDRIPGMICGNTILCITVNGLAPSEIAALSVSGSKRCSEAHTDKTMNGTRTCTRAISTPVCVYINVIGLSLNPIN